MDLKGRNFLTLKDFTPEEIRIFFAIIKRIEGKEEKWDQPSDA